MVQKRSLVPLEHSTSTMYMSLIMGFGNLSNERNKHCLQGKLPASKQLIHPNYIFSKVFCGVDFAQEATTFNYGCSSTNCLLAKKIPNSFSNSMNYSHGFMFSSVYTATSSFLENIQEDRLTLLLLVCSSVDLFLSVSPS